MKVPFGFGSAEILIDIPDRNLAGILHANEIERETDESNIIVNALSHPIDSPRLRELVKPGEKIAIITSDITRPMPSKKVLPFILSELKSASIRDEDILIVFALGSHRPHTDDEKIRIVGEQIFNQYRCIDSIGEFVHLGETKAGTPVDIFKPVAEADRRICIGNIEYHYFAGYSGGAKAIMPGVSTRNAIQANHSRMTDPNACAGQIDSNPVRNDIDSVVDFISIDFIVNVILDEHKHICHCVAGHYRNAHRRGCDLLDKLYRIEISHKADIVIVSSGGYPKDINLYQAQKALDNAGHAVKDGGTILWIASAAEGLGEKHFEDWMIHHSNPSEMIDHIQREFVLGGHKAAAIAMVLERADIILITDLEPSIVERVHLHAASDAQKALDNLLIKYGSNASVLAMPFGGATLPVVLPK
ncbi:nickel-dependent lactate racemase family protein [Flexilinea flocculi]|jgi:nickel-dependent lactate racemase|uniref:Nickel-dependent lactate racemase n=1 Tax=Flexilinea flocculi TaxID=1678840 RepID=A0A0S7BXP4_9CHLR|nr:nickel-dependent lactate racemase [Flexilinea flocculi]GAP41400.1 nickel-dependent lactate racemase [Flexilinea flocculi]